MDPVLERLRAELTGRYEVEQELGRGGMAVVYLAKDLRHERRVAIKVLRSDLGSSGSERFLREIRTVAQLHHPHIVALHDSGSVDGHLFYVMPYVEGETLREKLEREGQLPVDEAVRIASEVADALDFAHSRGIVHRDIKPENIFLSAGHALVADFGIARAADAAKQGENTLTDAGLAVGTPAYMSPEQATADPRIDGRSDQYALGCVLYEMLAGQPPFAGPTSQAVMARHTADPVPPLRTVRAVPAVLEHAITKALAKVPADRWASTRAFAQALPVESTADAVSVPPRRVSPWPVAIVAMVVALAGATLIPLFRNMETEAGARPAVQRVALLPFGFDGDSQWKDLAAGLNEALYTAFTHVEGLSPIAGARVADYARRTSDPREVGRDLRAGAVVSGDVRVAGNRVRVTLQLTDVGDRPVVREEFNADLLVDGRLQDIFELQDSLKVRILDFLQIRLSAANRAALARGVLTRDRDAYNLFLRGRHELQDVSLEGARRAVVLFEEAIARDSTFADAWAGLAEAYASLYQLDAIRPVEVAAKWRRSADKAIRYDSTNGYALSLRGALQIQYDWDLEGGLETIRAAVRATPSSPDVWFLHAVFQNLVAQHDSALASMNKAVSLDPTNPFLWTNLGFRFRFLGMTDSAIVAHERALGIDTTQWLPRMALAELYLGTGRRADADRMVEWVLKFAGDSQPFILGHIAMYFGRSGQPGRARTIVASLERVASRQYVPGIYLGQGRLAVGDSVGALDALEQSVINHDLDLGWWLIEAFAAFSGNPRYEAFRRQVFGDLVVPRGFPAIHR
jgi:TolB-like protein/predicted Ser/Thr protein kinase